MESGGGRGGEGRRWEERRGEKMLCRLTSWLNGTGAIMFPSSFCPSIHQCICLSTCPPAEPHTHILWLSW